MKRAQILITNGFIYLFNQSFIHSCIPAKEMQKKAPVWRRGMSKTGAFGTVYNSYTIHPPSFNQIIKEL